MDKIDRTKKRLAVFAYILHGHHLSHVKLLLEQSTDFELIVTRDFLDKLKRECDLTGRTVYCLSNVSNSPRFVFRSLRKFIRNNSHFDEVITTTLDEFWPFLLKYSLLGLPWLPKSTALSGIWVASNFLYTLETSFKSRTVYNLLKLLIRLNENRNNRIMFFNELLWRKLSEDLDVSSQRLQWCPDPFSGTIPSDQTNHSDNRPPICLMAGHHKPRKGTQWALESLRLWDGDKLRVFIVGEVSGLPDLNHVIDLLPQQIEVELIDRRVSEEELMYYYQICDAVLLPYRKFGGSSGVFVNALAQKRPVVVPDWGIICDRTKRLGCGAIFEHDSAKSFCASIKAVLNEDRFKLDQDKVNEFLACNSKEKFTLVFLGRGEIACIS